MALPVWTPEKLVVLATPCSEYPEARVRKLLGAEFTVLDVLMLELPESLSPIIQAVRMLCGATHYICIETCFIEARDYLSNKDILTRSLELELMRVERCCMWLCDQDFYLQERAEGVSARMALMNSDHRPSRIRQMKYVSYCTSFLYALATYYPGIWFNPGRSS